MTTEREAEHNHFMQVSDSQALLEMTKMGKAVVAGVELQRHGQEPKLPRKKSREEPIALAAQSLDPLDIDGKPDRTKNILDGVDEVSLSELDE